MYKAAPVSGAYGREGGTMLGFRLSEEEEGSELELANKVKCAARLWWNVRKVS